MESLLASRRQSVCRQHCGRGLPGLAVAGGRLVLDRNGQQPEPLGGQLERGGKGRCRFACAHGGPVIRSTVTGRRGVSRANLAHVTGLMTVSCTTLQEISATQCANPCLCDARIAASREADPRKTETAPLGCQNAPSCFDCADFAAVCRSLTVAVSSLTAISMSRKAKRPRSLASTP
jgi:hypothetical protein